MTFTEEDVPTAAMPFSNKATEHITRPECQLDSGEDVETEDICRACR